ncbi:MAG TPA: exodeoxyribonuclease VII small subunit [Oligoflexia bacterium]|nr:exodeoxyribonuclease VII small subunit [Oligoflexia bacterium]HMP26659.1 exodeoxyribonuclease VII small subunit [Oligoflexia bacterium]
MKASGKKKGISLNQLLGESNFKNLIAEISFEEGITLLEELVEKTRRAEINLAEAVDAYERGALLAQRLKTLLADAELKIQELKKNK